MFELLSSSYKTLSIYCSSCYDDDGFVSFIKWIYGFLTQKQKDMLGSSNILMSPMLTPQAPEMMDIPLVYRVSKKCLLSPNLYIHEVFGKLIDTWILIIDVN